jgi:MFS family permease
MRTPRKTVFYGWVVTVVCFLTVMVSTAARQSLIIKFPSLLEEFGWNRAALSVAPSLAGFTASFCALIIGIISDRWDVKKILCVGAVIAATGLLLCSTTKHLWHIYLFFGIITSIGVSALSLFPNTIIVSNWFVKRRGLAIGIIASGTGGGTLIFMPVLQVVILRYGWRFSFISLAVLAVVMIPVILLFQRTDPRQMGLLPDGLRETGDNRPAASSDRSTGAQTTAVRETSDERTEGIRKWDVLSRLASNRRFCFAYIQCILGPLSTTPISAHQAVFFVDKGFDRMTAAMVVGVYGLGTFLGMLLSGYLSDRLSREVSYTIGTASLILGCLFLLLVRTGSSILLPILYALSFGLGFGSRPSMDAASAADLFTGRHFGFIYGILNTGLGIGQLFGPVLSGFIFDVTGSYTVAILFCICGVSIATVCIWLAAPRHGNEYELMIRD